MAGSGLRLATTSNLRGRVACSVALRTLQLAANDRKTLRQGVRNIDLNARYFVPLSSR